MKKLKAILELMRVKHWVKNLLIFVPAVAARDFSGETWISLGIGFLAFSLITSFIYIVNDLRDIEKDRAHPRKKTRPLPSGRVKRAEAIILAVIVLAGGLTLEYFAGQGFLSLALVFLASYIVVNLGYSFGLKNVVVIDVALLSAGFIIRVYYGAALAAVAVSNWLFLTVLSASMFLALGKRRKESAAGGAAVRKVLGQYSKEFLEKFMYAFLTMVFVFYALWASETGSTYLLMTTILVIIIFMKYCLILEKTDEGDPTTIIYSDKVLLMICLAYAVVMGLIFGLSGLYG